MPSETVRIQPETHRKLRQIATSIGESMTDTLEKAVEAYRRQLFLEEANRRYAALRGDSKRWAEELAERSAWDATLADGQEEVDP